MGAGESYLYVTRLSTHTHRDGENHLTEGRTFLATLILRFTHLGFADWKSHRISRYDATYGARGSKQRGSDPYVRPVPHICEIKDD